MHVFPSSLFLVERKSLESVNINDVTVIGLGRVSMLYCGSTIELGTVVAVAALSPSGTTLYLSMLVRTKQKSFLKNFNGGMNSWWLCLYLQYLCTIFRRKDCIFGFFTTKAQTLLVQRRGRSIIRVLLMLLQAVDFPRVHVPSVPWGRARKARPFSFTVWPEPPCVTPGGSVSKHIFEAV
jgi:hypothetical protein